MSRFLLLLVVLFTAAVVVLAAGDSQTARTQKASIGSDGDGSLIITTPGNGSAVLVNGRDLVGKLSAQVSTNENLLGTISLLHDELSSLQEQLLNRTGGDQPEPSPSPSPSTTPAP